MAQMVIGSTIAKPELYHWPVKHSDAVRRFSEAISLSDGAADEAVEPTHLIQRTQVNLSGASLFQLADSFLQLAIGALEAKGKFAHDLD